MEVICSECFLEVGRSSSKFMISDMIWCMLEGDTTF